VLEFPPTYLKEVWDMLKEKLKKLAGFDENKGYYAVEEMDLLDEIVRTDLPVLYRALEKLIIEKYGFLSKDETFIDELVNTYLEETKTLTESTKLF
jgi:hypothetical protein